MKKTWNIESSNGNAAEDEKLTNCWQGPYSNLMVIMMILFNVLYSYTYMADKKQYEAALARIQVEVGGSDMTGQLKQILQTEKHEGMEEMIESKGLKKFVDVIMNEEGMKITLRNPVLFTRGEAELSPETEAVLREVVNMVKDSDDDVVVEGFTCNMPIYGGKYKSNWELSAARAFSVVRYLIKQGISPGRLAAIGYGESRALYPNDTEEHRALNRRIEINVINKK